MAEQKTKPTAVSVDGFLRNVANAQMREDAFAVLAMMKEITGLQPKMWGPASSASASSTTSMPAAMKAIAL